jgi:flagellar biogenesis protein FliO
MHAPCRTVQWIVPPTVLMAPAALAQDTSPTYQPHSPVYYLLQAGLSLAIVIGLIYAVHFGLRRVSSAGLPRRLGQVQVRESRHLGGGRWIYVIEVAGRILVIGGGSDGMRTLAEMPAERYHAHESGAGEPGEMGNEAGD